MKVFIKNSANVMYIIGKVFNILSFAFYPIMFIIGLIMMISHNAPDAKYKELSILGAYMLVLSIPLFILSIISLVVCRNRKRLIDQGTESVSPMVVLIVFGAILNNIFYLLSGIFSLVARNQEFNSKQN